MRPAALFLVLALPAAAQQRASDTPFIGTGLSDTLSGQTIEFYDNSLATYRADGSYEYRYEAGGPVWAGEWTADESEVCVIFDNGFSRCDTFVQANERLVLIIENGDRYPVRAGTPTE